MKTKSSIILALGIALPVVLLIGLGSWVVTARLERKARMESRLACISVRDSIDARLRRFAASAREIARRTLKFGSGREGINWGRVDPGRLNWMESGALVLELLDRNFESRLVDFVGAHRKEFLFSGEDSLWLKGGVEMGGYSFHLVVRDGGSVLKVGAPIAYMAGGTLGYVVLSYDVHSLVDGLDSSGFGFLRVDLFAADWSHVYPSVSGLKPARSFPALLSREMGGGEEGCGGLVTEVGFVGGSKANISCAVLGHDHPVLGYLCVSRERGDLDNVITLVKGVSISLGVLAVILAFVFVAFSRRVRRGRNLENVLVELDRMEKGEDDYTAQLWRVVEAVARRMGVEEGGIQTLRYATSLHNMGKVAISSEILKKPGPLDSSERTLIELHPRVAERMMGSLKISRDVIETVKYHHERYDGTGYPDRLAGEQIPLYSRILAAAEAYVAMRIDLPYRPAKSPEEAAADLRENSGKQFDPKVVRVMLDLIEEGVI